jgi:hypothetical protein
LAQYINDPGFDPVSCPGPFNKYEFDPDFIRAEERRVTRAWRRLQAIPHLGLSVAEYPLTITPDEETNR